MQKTTLSSVPAVKKSLSEPKFKLFKFFHDGKWTFGVSLVIAETRPKAFKLLKAKLKELGLALDNIECEELDATKASVTLLVDGVY